MQDVTAQVAAWAAGLSLDAVPASVVAKAKLLLADITGIALLTRQESESTPSLVGALRALELDRGRFRCIGDPAGYAAPAAALLTGAMAHSIDFDDTHVAALHHPSAPVIPAALVAAQVAGASGRELLAGIVVGVEVMCRIGVALGPGSHYGKGFYATPTCGAFGATAAAARVLGLSATQVEHAFGTALSETSGSGQFHVNGAWTKRFQVGHAAACGLTAAALAQAGFTGASEALEGASGFYRLYSNEARPERTVQDLGQQWEIARIGFKPYPACRGMHAAVDAALALYVRHQVPSAEIASATVGLCRQSLDLVGWPEDRKQQPTSVIEAQFSAPFGVAVGLRHGRLGWSDYATELCDPTIRALMSRIHSVHDADVEALFPSQVAGRVTITTQSGQSFSELVPIPRGEPENPLSEAELRAKFDGLVLPYLGSDGATALFAWILDLEHQPGLDTFFDLALPRIGGT
ncbi:MAG: MmgE/PrpD family protein [Chloroflexi bacterium]|nr:MmgE/PrpD family protein [Chloroflexota bacterium]